MRTRTRLLWTFLSVHLGISILAGIGASTVMHAYLRGQAEESARSVAKVLADGGFAMNKAVREKMERLTGYRFEVLVGPRAPEPGAIQAEVGDVVVQIDYRTPAYRRAQNLVWWGTVGLVVVGLTLFGLLSWRSAARIARPLERLAAAARAIGGGDLEHSVPEVGDGEVLQLARELEQMRRQLVAHHRDERLRTLGLFTATVAHEVRNPLSAVRLTIQMLQQRRPDERDLALIAEEMERLDLTVDELLAYSRGMSAEPRPCDGREIADGIGRLLARQAEHAGVAIEVTGEGRFRADPARLKQLLLNLVLNAIQAQHGGGSVSIAVRNDGLSVADDGPGIEPTRVAGLFEPFDSDRAEGTGLGLHLAKAVTDAHGADLTYRPRPEGGSEFRLSGLRPLEPETEGQGAED